MIDQCLARTKAAASSGSGPLRMKWLLPCTRMPTICSKFYPAVRFACILRLLSGHVGGDCQDVVVGQFADDGFHHGGRRAGALAALEVIELASDVNRREAGD